MLLQVIPLELTMKYGPTMNALTQMFAMILHVWHKGGLHTPAYPMLCFLYGVCMGVAKWGFKKSSWSHWTSCFPLSLSSSPRKHCRWCGWWIWAIWEPNKGDWAALELPRSLLSESTSPALNAGTKNSQLQPWGWLNHFSNILYINVPWKTSGYKSQFCTTLKHPCGLRLGSHLCRLWLMCFWCVLHFWTLFFLRV